MKTIFLAIMISLASVSNSQVYVEVPDGKDESGLSAQIDRLLSTKEWPNGKAELIFGLDDMNLIKVYKVKSENKELAKKVEKLLHRQEVFPRLDAEQEFYVFNLNFGKRR